MFVDETRESEELEDKPESTFGRDLHETVDVIEIFDGLKVGRDSSMTRKVFLLQFDHNLLSETFPLGSFMSILLSSSLQHEIKQEKKKERPLSQM